jgi:hypothetical protein
MIERAERLVHQQDVGLVDQALRQRHALAHAARELMRMAVLELPEADPAQPITRAVACLRLVRAAEAGTDLDVLEHRLPRQQRVGLEHESDVTADGVDRVPVNTDVAFARALQAGDQRQRGGLAAAARADHGAELTGLDREVDVRQRGEDRAGRGAEALAHTAQLDRGLPPVGDLCQLAHGGAS